MSKITILKTEIQNDPLAKGYSSMSDQEIVDSINLKNRSKFVEISSQELLAWSANNGRLAKIKNAINNGADDVVKSLAEAAYLLITRDDTSLDLNLTDRVAMLDALVSYAVLIPDDKTSLQALATVSISRAEELDIGLVRAGDVLQARL